MRWLLAMILAVSLVPLLAPDVAAQQRRWAGTAPFCSGTCGSGEVEVARRASAPTGGDPLAYNAPPFGSACWTGTKALCEKRPKGASCTWRGTAPFCSGACFANEAPAPAPPGSSSGASCWSGKKVYCCTK